MLRIEVDRASAVAPYRQVATAIIEAIRAGEYAPGDRLPSVDDLVAGAGIAERTARKALRLVASEGYAQLSTGMGWYVPETLPGHGGGT